MCGICGFVTRGEDFGEETITRMTELLTHRGPDRGGVYLNRVGGEEPSRSLGRGDVALGHRRLSIIDLSESASQPMGNEDGTVWLVFNGEVYNFAELRAQLVDRGHRFKSKGDSEVIVHGYEEWGEGLFERLNGMFVVALWDSKRERLVLARDRLGIKPLFFYIKGTKIVFASELTSIRVHPVFEESIDRESLYDYLMLSYVPSPWTIFEGVKKLQPGTYMVWEMGEVRFSRYWQVPVEESIGGPGIRNPVDGARGVRVGSDVRGGKTRSMDDYMEELESILMDSVSKRLISDVPLGAFLSGGVDSSLVVAMMKKVSDGEVRTFSIGFEEEGFDESKYARRVAEHLKTDHTEFKLNPALTGELLRSVVLHMDEPMGDPSAVPTYLVSKLARESGITVALSGDGGDELFCGYERYRKMALVSEFYRLPAALRRAAFSLLCIFGRLGKWGSLETLAHEDLASSYLSRMSSWKDGADMLKEMLGGAGGRSKRLFSEIFSSARGLGALDRMTAVDIRTYLVDDVLTKVDRMSMAVSLEVRVPILDHRVVEFARMVPLWYRFDGSELKLIMRRLLRKYIPDELVDRPKAGFAMPVRKWLLEDMRNDLLESLSPDRIREEGLLDEKLVAEAIRLFESRDYGVTRFIWGLYIFEKWMELLGPGNFTTSPESFQLSLSLAGT